MLSDNGPDAYEVAICCPHCDGNQTLSAAYSGVFQLLKQAEAKYRTNYAIIWRLGYGDGNALTRMREIAEALKNSPAHSNAAWAHDRLLELAATYEAHTSATTVPVYAECYVCGKPMDGTSEDDCHCFHRRELAAPATDSEATAAQQDGWSPIKTAPTKETEPFLILRRGIVVQASWFEGRLYPDAKECCIDWEDGIMDATAWRPLFAAPANGEVKS